MKKTTGIAAAAVLVAVGTAGCGTTVTQKAGESAQSMIAALDSASDEVSKAGSADISMTVTAPATGGKPVTARGFYSWGDGPAMETEMPASNLQMGALAADGTITMRLVKGAYYYEVDRLKDGPFTGKTWLKVEASAVIGEKGAAGMGGANSDPTAGLKTLKYAKDVDKVGTESVNGKSTVHYRATVPADKMGAAAADLYKGLSVSGDVVTDIWVDPKGTPARMTQTIGTTTMSMDFLSFGGTRTVDIPPAAETGDMTELYKQRTKGKAA